MANRLARSFMQWQGPKAQLVALLLEKDIAHLGAILSCQDNARSTTSIRARNDRRAYDRSSMRSFRLPRFQRRDAMAQNSPRKRPLLLILGILLPIACSPVSQNPALRANLDKESTRTATSSTSAADLNRNIVAAAMIQSSASSSDYQIGPEDLLEITLFNIPEIYGMERQQMTPRLTTLRVSQQGHISLPVLGAISVKGLTISALEQRLRDAYDKYIHNPQVGVLVKEFRQRASVIGAVQKPGVIELSGPKTVIDLLAMAGGVTEKAGSQVHIYRQGLNGRETHVIDLAVLANSIGLISANNAEAVNMPVQPGDMINVPEAGMFFVDGAVRKPGSYSLGRRYSLTQALATAGGVDSELNSSDISILRRNGPGEVETLAYDLNAILAGSSADPQIHPDDVIILSISTAKYIVKRFIGQLVSGISIGSFIAGS
jgi:polysaccharide export outer membrane protein